MTDPISTEDLYGPSNPPVPEGQSVQKSVPVTAPEPMTHVSPTIPIEETPEITPQPSIPPPSPAGFTPPGHEIPPHSNTSIISTLGAIILFAGLFIVGMLLSGTIRQFIPGGFTQEETTKEVVQPLPIPTATDPLSSWTTYQILSSSSKQPISGVSFKLPPDVLPPICDGTTCMSQGTYLPGGTRLTVAPRGVGQALVDFRGRAISDVSGTVFTAENTTVAGHVAQLFTGSFTGRTVAGYGFTKMRGYMIEVTPSLSLELNHFTPTGITTDFASDDVLFDQIVSSLRMPDATPVTPAVRQPSSATTSGY